MVRRPGSGSGRGLMEEREKGPENPQSHPDCPDNRKNSKGVPVFDLGGKAGAVRGAMPVMQPSGQEQTNIPAGRTDCSIPKTGLSAGRDVRGHRTTPPHPDSASVSGSRMSRELDQGSDHASLDGHRHQYPPDDIYPCRADTPVGPRDVGVELLDAGPGLPPQCFKAGPSCRRTSMPASTRAISVLVAGSALIRATCSPACASVKPQPVRRLMKRCVSDAIASVMPAGSGARGRQASIAAPGSWAVDGIARPKGRRLRGPVFSVSCTMAKTAGDRAGKCGIPDVDRTALPVWSRVADVPSRGAGRPAAHSWCVRDDPADCWTGTGRAGGGLARGIRATVTGPQPTPSGRWRGPGPDRQHGSDGFMIR